MELSKLNSGPLSIKLIKHFESLHDGDLSKVGLQPKMCPAGIWTEGYGHAMIDPRTGGHLRGEENRQYALQLSKIKDETTAERVLASDLDFTYEPAVAKLITRTDLVPEQLGALTSFAYNCGTHYINKQGQHVPYKIWSLVNLNVTATELEDYWKTSVITAAGKELKGLVLRRASEAYLFCHGKLNF